MSALRHLNKYLLKYKTPFLKGIISAVCARIFLLFAPRLIGNLFTIVDAFLRGTASKEITKTNLATTILYIIGTTSIGGVLSFFMRRYIIDTSRAIEFDLKNEIYNHYQSLSLDFYKKNRTGDLMHRISEDVSNVRMYVGPAIMYSINTITLFAIAFFYMFSEAPRLASYTILPLPFLSILIYKLSKEIHKRSTLVQEHLSKLSTYTQEAFSGISVIKAYHIESKTSAHFKALTRDNKDKHIHLAKVQSWFFPTMVLLIGISNILVLYIGGVQYIDGKINSIGTIAEFMIYVNILTWPVTTVGWVTSIVQQAEASQKRINVFLKRKPTIKNTAPTSTNISGTIRFDKVSFTYEDTGIQALKNLSFDIKQGETLAILGKTGSGKSTILDLISRLYDTSKGTITINGISVKDHHLTSLRRGIGYVPQDAFLFSDTIMNNIKLGDDNATEQDVILAAKKAQIHNDIIKFKNGYNTILGERGITLSGGQKQRVAIARTLIKPTEIILFDDCLSAVDTETEENILKALQNTLKDKTAVIASHRISSVRNAHKVIVLKAGRIVQEGTHNTLLAVDGYYRTLYLKQRKKSPKSDENP